MSVEDRWTAGNEERPFYRVRHMTKYQAAVEQIDAAIWAFHQGKFAVATTLAGAAEEMAPGKEDGLWEKVREHLRRPEPDIKKWTSRLNETRNWLKHDKAEPTRNLVAFEVGFCILRAMDKWEPWTPLMREFKQLWSTSAKLSDPARYERK